MGPEFAMSSGNGKADEKRYNTLDREKRDHQGKIVHKSIRRKEGREHRFERVKQHRNCHADAQSRNCQMSDEEYGRSEKPQRGIIEKSASYFCLFQVVSLDVVMREAPSVRFVLQESGRLRRKRHGLASEFQ